VTKLRIGKKLNFAFYSLIGLMCISVIFSFISFHHIEKNMNEALGIRINTIKLISNIRSQVDQFDSAMVHFLLTDSENSLEKVNTYTELIDEEITALEQLTITDTMRNYLVELKEHKTIINEALEEAKNTGEYAVIFSLENEKVQNARKGLLHTAEEALQYQEAQLEEIKESAASSIHTSNIIAAIVLAISLLVSVILVLNVRKTITLPLRRMVEAVKVVSSGNLTEEDLQIRSKDEIGELSESFNTMKNNLKSLIRNVQQSTERLSSAAQQLSASTEEVASTTDEMASRVTATAEVAQTNSQAASDSAIAMDETAAGVLRIAESTQALHTSSMDASDTASNGEEIIRHAEKQMDTINLSTREVNTLVQKLAKQTQEIENISRVITEITDQTNLLALNAAIEAARAGEHGKGFAVVAEEVRKLAEESKESASQITDLTKEIKVDTENVEQAVASSLQSVEDGVNVITKAGHSFKNIVQAIEHMKIQIEEISATSEEISASAEEVSASVNEISIGSNESAADFEMIAASIEEQSATMEEVNKVAMELNENAFELQKEIQKFRI
jgi:methyl-accepting chemotaxis protein